MEVDNENIDDELENPEYILSLCWDSGVIAAVYYNLLTLELHVRNKY